MTSRNCAGDTDRGTEAQAAEDLGLTREYLCREPWESYYILRRGILPCCHGAKPIAPMSEWATAWNSPALQEIRSFLAKGKLSPYCLESTGCPVVQRHLEALRQKAWIPQLQPSTRPRWARVVNRLFDGAPARIYRRLTRTRR
ncbi:MAG TPA: hypothetical protein VF332_03630 [Vicinamibacterales bacterium]